ncbi:hypothetical protein MJN51_41080, partial [Salmonella enterica subsp. enterica serovar Kentucky]|nr:hypothetical protein [Salmonella enterica subsp. enterica serovar Kentucky]
MVTLSLKKAGIPLYLDKEGNVDTALLDAMKLEKRYRSIGILGARTGAGPHIMAADEAVKAT